jgi:hypothetical protein
VFRVRFISRIPRQGFGFHAQCLLGTYSITTALSTIHTFLIDNPNEMIILKLEMTDDSISLADVPELWTRSMMERFVNDCTKKKILLPPV